MEQVIIMPTFASLMLFCMHFTYVLAQSPLPAPVSAPPAPPTIPVSAQSPLPLPLPPPQPAAAPPAPTTTIFTQPPALAPAPTGPTNVTAILEKAHGFTTLIRLLKTTQSAERINTELNTTNQGLTILAPTDAAFASLKSGTLNSYTSEQQTELIQSHVLPSYLTISQFQTASNPMSTQAGGTNYGLFPLNVTTTGTSVNLTTGFAHASILNTVYTDNQLAIYGIDHVLLPQRFFVAPPPSPPPAPAPAPSKHVKKAQPPPAVSAYASNAVSLMHEISFRAFAVVGLLAAYWLF
ncbi:hypothetical protein ACH5RR_005447 [Cinchona calisaya]|uniref:FAS1 domain-containing protein n=1 Tax=Cinchona calisaya TaxID=153742 RepID=A0ABD3AL89_9GENT